MKTNICTNKDQSNRLLRCGVSDDTADMCWDNHTLDEPFLETGAVTDKRDTPAWSLSALLGLLPKEIYEEETGDSYFFSLAKEFPLSEEYGAAYIPCWDKGDAIVRKRDNDPIEACVQLIEWLTENNYKLNEQ